MINTSGTPKPVPQLWPPPTALDQPENAKWWPQTCTTCAPHPTPAPAPAHLWQLESSHWCCKSSLNSTGETSSIWLWDVLMLPISRRLIGLSMGWVGTFLIHLDMVSWMLLVWWILPDSGLVYLNNRNAHNLLRTLMLSFQVN